MNRLQNGPRTVRVLYDGGCPMCAAMAERLRRRDRHERLIFDNVADRSFDPTPFGLTQTAAEAAVHAVLPDGRVVSGMEAVRAAHTAAGWGWMIAPTGWPVLRPMFDRVYRIFAHHRRRSGATRKRPGR